MKNTIDTPCLTGPIRAFICDPEHPHHGESGTLTGKIILLFGKPMAEMKLENCRHGTDGCFVSQGQVSIEHRKRFT